MKANKQRLPNCSATVRDYAIYTLTPEGRVSGWNPDAGTVLGYTADEVMGTDFSLFFTSSDRALGKPQDLLHAAALAGWIEEDTWRVRKDGSVFEAHTTLTALRDSQASLLGFAKTVRDLTALRASEAAHAQQTSLLRLAHEAVIARDLQGRVTFWNRGAQSLYQWTAEEAFGRVIHEMLKTSFPIPLGEIETVVRRNAPWEGRLVHHRKDGTVVIVDSLWSLQRDENGMPTAILELNRDVTQHVAAEEMLRESNQRFQDAFEFAAIGKALLAPDGRWLRVNRAFAKMLGYTPDELTARTVASITPPEDTNLEEAQRTGFMTGKIDSRQFEKFYIRKDGERIRVLVSATSVKDANQQPLYFISEIQDITDRHKALASLAEQRNLFEAVLENMADGLFFTDSTGRVLIRNRVARSLFGELGDLPPEQWPQAYGLYRADRQTLFDYRDLPTWQIMQGKDSAELEMWIRNEATPKGASVYILTKAFVSLDGCLRGVITVVQDITQRKQMETELEWNRARATENARLFGLGMMAGAIAHEINNPLGIIHGSASNLLEMAEAGDISSPQLLKNSSRIVQTADRIARIVASLQLISREGSSDPFLDIPVNKIIDESLDLCCESFRIHFTGLTSSPVDPSLTVLCREGQIVQILMNLLQNALDAVETVEIKRSVSIEVAATQPWIEIAVLDNGPGFSPDAKKFAMNPFFTTKSAGKGTGLGLSISSTIAQSHGGRIEFCERAGLTCVSLLLPHRE